MVKQLTEQRRIDRAKAIREERQCSVQEAVEFERQEFEATNGWPLTGAALARWCYENPNQAAMTIEKLRETMMKEPLGNPDDPGWVKGRAAARHRS